MQKTGKPLQIGQRVRVQRISREEVDAVIVKGPLNHLRHIGEFYLVGKSAGAGEEPGYRGSARRSRELITWQEATGALGMYERAEIFAI